MVFADFHNADGSRHLVVDDIVVGAVGGIDESESCQSFDGIFEADERLSLFAFAVHRHGVASDRLGREAVVTVPK